jgi:hypothetical protein
MGAGDLEEGVVAVDAGDRSAGGDGAGDAGGDGACAAAGVEDVEARAEESGEAAVVVGEGAAGEDAGVGLVGLGGHGDT